MSDAEFRRRVMTAWGLDDKFKDFALGSYANERNADYINNLEKCAMSPWFPVIAGHSVTFNFGWKHSGYGNSICIIYTNNDYSKREYNDANGSSRTVNIQSNITLARMPLDMTYLHDAYAYDNTAGEYLWRGSDYVD